MPKHIFTRRDFFKTGTLGSASLMMTGGGLKAEPAATPTAPPGANPVTFLSTGPVLPSPFALNLSPARWIWYPATRTLANTFILFRKALKIHGAVESASGWILGDSRYELRVNGQRVQWGPPPADPRYSEADPMDLKAFLKQGSNVIAVTVLYYGYGDGTWPTGKPGLLFNLTIKMEDGTSQSILSDHTWPCFLARSWQPGHYKRWYLRALQEVFDASKYPFGWDTASYKMDKRWREPRLLAGNANRPAISTNNADYMHEPSVDVTLTELRKRSIPPLKEYIVPPLSLREVHVVKWHTPVEDYFDMSVTDAYDFDEMLSQSILSGFQRDSLPWAFTLPGADRGLVLTFEAEEQVVGWPFFDIEAPAGTVVEMMVQESHQLHAQGGPALMNNHHFSWSRFICMEGVNHFSPFDFESIMWIQLHIHGVSGRVKVQAPGIRRRIYDWPNQPLIHTDIPELQKMLNACVNTLNNNSQETIVDGMGRERQQYSGDVGHVVHALHRVFGDSRLPARFVNTFSQGMTTGGFFMDAWPAYDRLNRVAQRQLGFTKWGPLLDHGVGFNFDCYYHYLYSGKLDDLAEVWPRLKQFYHYLQSIVGPDGMLPVENLGIPAVWIDHEAYRQQRHKQCAFNLYTVAMLKNAFFSMAEAHGDKSLAAEAKMLGDSLWRATTQKFWDADRQLFIINKPWLNDEKTLRMCDRSLATSILFDLCPGNNTVAAVKALVDKPEHLGLSYPPNTCWYLWALAKAGQVDAIFNDFRDRWLKIPSIDSNNTMAEFWSAIPDTGSQWSHASIAPLLTTFMDLAGIKPITPGYKKFCIKPMPGPLHQLEVANHTPEGPILFALSGAPGRRTLHLTIPKNLNGEIMLDSREKVPLKNKGAKDGYAIYQLPEGEIKLKLKYL